MKILIVNIFFLGKISENIFGWILFLTFSLLPLFLKLSFKITNLLLGRLANLIKKFLKKPPKVEGRNDSSIDETEKLDGINSSNNHKN